MYAPIRRAGLATPTHRFGVLAGGNIPKNNNLDKKENNSIEEIDYDIQMESADLYDDRSLQQQYIMSITPTIPDIMKKFDRGNARFTVTPFEGLEASRTYTKEVSEENPNIADLSYLKMTSQPVELVENRAQWLLHKTNSKNWEAASYYIRTDEIRIGVILSGGPAPGGHNVICGMHNLLKAVNPGSEVVGFMGGIDGFFNKQTKMVTAEMVERYMNTGGFDMLWSGRGRFKDEKDLEKAVKILRELKLNALVIIGGDGSNSNAAMLSEYVAKVNEMNCVIVGVPKTIDGDLKSPAVECTFGFDTCAKTYSELIGNLCTDIMSSLDGYHFVRVMGRAASHLVLECALQTRPNLVFIGEEIRSQNKSLNCLVKECADLIQQRLDVGKHYGIILLPEGLIEFIPEVNNLIQVLNKVISQHSDQEFSDEWLKGDPEAYKTWMSFPEMFRYQLTMEREATGFVQVAKIQTERLLISMVKFELHNRIKGDSKAYEKFSKLSLMPHYFGYEGRCAIPSNFDQSYCYTLGMTASAIALQGLNGYMATISGLNKPVSQWEPAACPFVKLMTKKTVGDEVFTGIRQVLLDLNDPLLRTLNAVKSFWRTEDVYRVPGPIQFDGPTAHIANLTVNNPSEKDLLWGDTDSKQGVNRWVATKRPGQLSLLQTNRSQFVPESPEILRSVSVFAQQSDACKPSDPYTARQIQEFYPQLLKKTGYMCYSLADENNFESTNERIHPVAKLQKQDSLYRESTGKRIGLQFLSRQSPGVMNVLWGVYERAKLSDGRVIGFFGDNGILEGKGLEITDTDIQMFCNTGGCEMLGRSPSHILLDNSNYERVLQVVKRLRLDGLIFVGTQLTLTEATLLNEYFIKNNSSCSVIGVPASGSNNLRHSRLETNLGFDTCSKIYANLIGNVLSDAASMPKYWHFIRLLGRTPSCEVLECALQTHPNFVVIAEEYGQAQKGLQDVVDDIVELVIARSEINKNYGTVLIPDALFGHLGDTNKLLKALGVVKKEAHQVGNH